MLVDSLTVPRGNVNKKPRQRTLRRRMHLHMCEVQKGVETPGVPWTRCADGATLTADG
jgi:hypothetical protein